MRRLKLPTLSVAMVAGPLRMTELLPALLSSWWTPCPLPVSVDEVFVPYSRIRCRLRRVLYSASGSECLSVGRHFGRSISAIGWGACRQAGGSSYRTAPTPKRPRGVATSFSPFTARSPLPSACTHVHDAGRSAGSLRQPLAAKRWKWVPWQRRRHWHNPWDLRHRKHTAYGLRSFLGLQVLLLQRLPPILLAPSLTNGLFHWRAHIVPTARKPLRQLCKETRSCHGEF